MQPIKTDLTELLNIDFPIILAPMFAVSNKKMTIAAMNSGIAACMPALNWTTDHKMKSGILDIQKNIKKGALGIHLNLSEYNERHLQQLNICIDLKVDFIITSDGNPEKVIKLCKKSKIKVFCSLSDKTSAKKFEQLGANAIIAINNQAGGYTGTKSSEELISLLKKEVKIPIIDAGGVGNGKILYNRINNNAASACLLGSIFITSEETLISKTYKNACIKYTEKDIVRSSKLGERPLNIINTPYIQRLSNRQNWIQKILFKNKNLKLILEKRIFQKKLKTIQNSALSNSYKSFWVAGHSIKYTKSIRKTQHIISGIIAEYHKLDKEKRLMSRSISRES